MSDRAVSGPGERKDRKLLIIDIPRQPSLLHAVRLAGTLPFAILVPSVHDGYIASLGSYSRSALRALAQYADPAITLELRGGAFTPQIVVASRLHTNP